MSDESKFFYANALEAGATVYDVNLKFVRNGTDTQPTLQGGFSKDIQPVVKDFFTVAMSVSHAKAMIPVLFNLIVQYENQFGSVPMPPDMKSLWDSTFPRN